MKYRSIFSVMSKSAITPSFRGRTARMCAGVRPIIRLASAPTARMAPFAVFTATTDGSFRTIPRPRTYTSVFAVPRSTAMSRPRKPDSPVSFGVVLEATFESQPWRMCRPFLQDGWGLGNFQRGL